MVIYCFCFWEWLAGSTSFPLAQIWEQPTVRACAPSALVQHGARDLKLKINQKYVSNLDGEVVFDVVIFPVFLPDFINFVI